MSTRHELRGLDLRSNPKVLDIATTPLLTPEACNAVIASCGDGEWRASKIYAAPNEDSLASGELTERNDDVRSSLERLVPGGDDGQIAQQIRRRVVEVNDEIYGFAATGLEPRVRVLRYRAGQHFGAHLDLGASAPLRKLSFSLLLSDAADFEGGELEFMDGLRPPSQVQGVLTVFPAFLWHHVTRLVAGERWVVVGHLEGPTFT